MVPGLTLYLIVKPALMVAPPVSEATRINVSLANRADSFSIVSAIVQENALMAITKILMMMLVQDVTQNASKKKKNIHTHIQ
jgi:hypothetical protein